MQDDLVPKSDWILGLIEQIYAKGVRRPGYPANRWAVEFCAERFREFGLENVRLEPVSAEENVPYQIDGDVVGTLPVAVSIDPQPLLVRLPASLHSSNT